MGILYGEMTHNDDEQYTRLHKKGTEKAFTYGYAPFQGFVSQIAAVLTHRVQEKRLATLKGVPTLVITGTHDSMVRPSNSYAIAKILDVEPVVLHGRGHHLAWECPEEINKLIHEHAASSS